MFAVLYNYLYKIEYTNSGYFLINGRYAFEIGGKNKTTMQIKDIKNAFVAADNIKYGHHNTIPLWLFGFLLDKNKKRDCPFRQSQR
ncbi:MAG: hypothetical protein LBV69_01230 [Bacteroidales bacterium]|nr:hypothetical protein [Bacteroidales bacterium]